MAEQIIDIRERIEKMQIKFEDDHKSDLYDVSDNEKKITYEKKQEISDLPKEVINHQNKRLNLIKTILYRNQRH